MVRRADTSQYHPRQVDELAEAPTFNYLDEDDFDAGMQIASVRAFVAWAQHTGVLDTGELPDCWSEHPALADLLAAIAAARYGAAAGVREGNYGRDLAQWWSDWTPLCQLFTRWTDSCQREHTPD